MSAFAAFELRLSPAVIDGEAKAREILRYKMTLTNESKRMLSIYPWARDIESGGTERSRDGVDPATSLLSWLEFSRAQTDILAGESVEIPVLVQVHLRAKPGVYHAMLYFSNGPNRPEAELNAEETASLMITIRVPDDANERLALGTFASDKNMFTDAEATFGYKLENTGNRGLIPSGKIRIFDRRGEEVDTIEVNSGASKIEPSATELIGAVWQSGDHFGRYKAMLDVSYGKTGTIQDTVFFWVLPWKRLLSMFLTLALVCVVLSLLFHSYTTSGGKKFAHIRATVDDDETGSMKERVSKLYTASKSRFQQILKISPLAQERIVNLGPIDQIVEVEPPAPMRTRFSTLNTEGSGSVRLAHRKKHPTHDPAHVINLKR